MMTRNNKNNNISNLSRLTPSLITYSLERLACSSTPFLPLCASALLLLDFFFTFSLSLSSPVRVIAIVYLVVVL